MHGPLVAVTIASPVVALVAGLVGVVVVDTAAKRTPHGASARGDRSSPEPQLRLGRVMPLAAAYRLWLS